MLRECTQPFYTLFLTLPLAPRAEKTLPSGRKLFYNMIITFRVFLSAFERENILGLRSDLARNSSGGGAV